MYHFDDDGINYGDYSSSRIFSCYDSSSVFLSCYGSASVFSSSYGSSSVFSSLRYVLDQCSVHRSVHCFFCGVFHCVHSGFLRGFLCGISHCMICVLTTGFVTAFVLAFIALFLVFIAVFLYDSAAFFVFIVIFLTFLAEIVYNRVSFLAFFCSGFYCIHRVVMCRVVHCSSLAWCDFLEGLVNALSLQVALRRLSQRLFLGYLITMIILWVQHAGLLCYLLLDV